MNEYAGLKLWEHNGDNYFADTSMAEAWATQYHGRKPDRLAQRLQANAQEAAQAERRQAFTMLHGLTKTTYRGCMIHKLLDPRQVKCRCYWGTVSRCPIVSANEEALGWPDHVDFWYNAAKAAYTVTLQPYHVSVRKYQALEKWCKDNGLLCSIEYAGAWHYPGWAPLIVIHGHGKVAPKVEAPAIAQRMTKKMSDEQLAEMGRNAATAYRTAADLWSTAARALPIAGKQYKTICRLGKLADETYLSLQFEAERRSWAPERIAEIFNANFGCSFN